MVKCKLFIGTPMFGSKCFGVYLESIVRLVCLCNQLGIETIVSTMCNESLLPRSRNYIVDEFMRSDSSHLLLVDADIVFHPEDVIMMIRLDLDIVGAQYPRKQMGIHWDRVASAAKNGCPSHMLYRLTGRMEKEIIVGKNNNVNVIETDMLELGFMLVKKLVLQRLQVAYPENFYTPDHLSNSFFNGSRNIQMYFSSEVDPLSHKLLSEYEFFCNSWKNIGGKIHVCPWITVSHIGLLKYC